MKIVKVRLNLIYEDRDGKSDFNDSMDLSVIVMNHALDDNQLKELIKSDVHDADMLPTHNYIKSIVILEEHEEIFIIPKKSNSQS
jgi:hypothetical protein